MKSIIALTGPVSSTVGKGVSVGGAGVCVSVAGLVAEFITRGSSVGISTVGVIGTTVNVGVGEIDASQALNIMTTIINPGNNLLFFTITSSF
jgi:hypothetical protein